jgi:L-threonylcarbamoyladenylate synthase
LQRFDRFAMIVPAAAPDSIAACASAIRAGSLIGLPTETVYGLGADADSDAAVAQVFAAKGRPADHPLIVHVAAFDGGMAGVAHFAQKVPAFAQQLMSAFWPGPLTLILPRRAGAGAASAGGQDTIGLRCPAHPAAQALLAALRKPGAGEAVVWGIAAPSANKFGRVSPTTAAHVHSEFGDDLLVLDGGPCEVGIESTIIDCTRGAPVLLRPGAISALQVVQACGQRLLSKEELHALAAQGQSAPKASGTLESHYAPNARVCLMSAADLKAALDAAGQNEGCGGGCDAATIAVYARSPLTLPVPSMTVRAMAHTASGVAHELFAVLRELDVPGLTQIWVEAVPDGVEWDGVRDRLQRASAA